ncbi:MAG: hypothetical protein IPM51_01055 [Sphingobacteriaceae bacterium]|nr:hypothetical protein [Sphingobacteriaceae bacterium]
MKQPLNLILAFFALFLQFSMNAQCSDSSVIYKSFKAKWNQKVEIFKEGTWKLPDVDFTKSKVDSFELLHTLQRSGINMIVNLTKTGCIKRVSLLAKKDENLDVQSLVAMIYLFEFFNHELSSYDRQKVLDGLKNESLENKKPSSKVAGKNTYVFEPGLIVNVLTVFIGS